MVKLCETHPANSHHPPTDNVSVSVCFKTLIMYWLNSKFQKNISLYIYIYTGWWFGTFFIFPYIGNFIIPTDELIFFRGVGIPPTRLFGTMYTPCSDSRFPTCADLRQVSQKNNNNNNNNKNKSIYIYIHTYITTLTMTLYIIYVLHIKFINLYLHVYQRMP